MLTYINWGHVTENALYCVLVFTVFLRTIFSDERFIGTPPKEVLHLDLSITKYIFCCKTSIVLGIKSEELCLLMCNRPN